jgi:hypothetical protein
MTIMDDNLRRTALRELANPSGAYNAIITSSSGDRVNTGDNHPLSWILRGEEALMKNNRLLRRGAAA